MRILARFLLVFMALRLLAPPGVCLGELLQPAERLFADVFGGPRAPAHCDDEDPICGCILSQLPPGVEAQHVPAPPPPALSLEPLPSSVAATAPTGESFLARTATTLPPADHALYLSHCALVI